jgi:hypothetical protein
MKMIVMKQQNKVVLEMENGEYDYLFDAVNTVIEDYAEEPAWFETEEELDAHNKWVEGLLAVAKGMGVR